MVALLAALALASPAVQASPAPSVSSVPRGEYRLDMGSEWRRLRLVSEHAFAFEARGCFHGERVEGHYTVSGGRILFDPSIPLEDSHRLASELQVVPWGKAALLVPRSELANLAEMARTGSDPAKVAPWFLHVAATKGELAGGPTLPAPFDRYLKAPRTFRVRRVEGLRATIEGGTRDGLLPGTCLASKVGETSLVARVERSSEAWAEVAWIAFGEEAALRPGSRLELAKNEAFAIGRCLVGLPRE